MGAAELVAELDRLARGARDAARTPPSTPRPPSTQSVRNTRSGLIRAPPRLRSGSSAARRWATRSLALREPRIGALLLVARLTCGLGEILCQTSRSMNSRFTIRSSREWKLMMAAMPPGASRARPRPSSRAELIELAVDLHAKGLERAGRRVDAAHSARPDGAHDGAPQIERGLELAVLQRLLDAAGDAARGRSSPSS